MASLAPSAPDVSKPVLSKPVLGRPGVGRAIDLLERAVVLAMFAAFVFRNYEAVVQKGQWFNALMIASEALVAVFIIVRRRGVDVSERPGDFVLAFAATIGPLMARATSQGHPLIPVGAGAGLLMLGLLTQLSAKLTLRRSFGIIPANRGIKASGPYRYVRHPMYLGYVTTHVGFLLLAPNAWNLVIYGASFAIQIVRIGAEERLLGRDPAYAAFAETTRWRLLPGVY